MNNQNKENQVAVVIGRWQFPHKGHSTLINKAFEIAERVIIVIGSAYHSRDPRNPFTWEERQAMLLSTLTDEQHSRVALLPIRDYYDDDRWEQAVVSGVERLIEHQSQVTLVGYKKDETSEYLDRFETWAKCDVAPEVNICSTALREMYFSSSVEVQTALKVMSPYIHPGVKDYLLAWSFLPLYAEAVKEAEAVRGYRKKYTAPYYLTADALVVASGKVLLIRRGKDIGHGLYALPGGHLEKNERYYQAAVRELAEETGIRLLPERMRLALKGAQEFDHPLRSPRGRLVTKVHYFDFKDREPFETHAGDDANETLWVNISDILSLESQIFEDHCCALDHFLGIFPTKISIPEGAYCAWRKTAVAVTRKAC